MNSNKYINFRLSLLQNKTQRFSKDNISKLRTQSELIIALKKKYPIFFDIIEKQGIQYKQFLSAFFLCILSNNNEPFNIRIENSKSDSKSKYEYKIYDKYTANYNYITVLPWNKYNIVKCFMQNSTSNIRINKEQFMQSVIVLFPKFIKKYPKIFFELNKKLEDTEKKTISIVHLYKYLVYCGDKIAKTEYNNKNKKNFLLSYKKIETFLRIFSYEQLINILVNFE